MLAHPQQKICSLFPFYNNVGLTDGQERGDVLTLGVIHDSLDMIYIKRSPKKSLYTTQQSPLASHHSPGKVVYRHRHWNLGRKKWRNSHIIALLWSLQGSAVGTSTRLIPDYQCRGDDIHMYRWEKLMSHWTEFISPLQPWALAYKWWMTGLGVVWWLKNHNHSQSFSFSEENTAADTKQTIRGIFTAWKLSSDDGGFYCFFYYVTLTSWYMLWLTLPSLCSFCRQPPEPLQELQVQQLLWCLPFFRTASRPLPL